jgi:hypothetical protein
MIFGKPGVKQMAQQNQESILGKRNKAEKTLHYALQNTGSISHFVELGLQS